MKYLSFICCVFLSVSLGCKEKHTSILTLKPGDVVSIKQGEGFCIAKILDNKSSSKDSFITIYLYKNKFPHRPDSLDYKNLKFQDSKDVWGTITWDAKGFGGLQPMKFYEDSIIDSELTADSVMNEIINKTIELMERNY